MFSICVRGSHDHRKANDKEISLRTKLGVRKEECFVCNPKLTKPEFYCKEYSDSITVSPSNPSWVTAVRIFNDWTSPFWLPPELHKFIFKYFKGPVTPITQFTKDTINHIKSCNLCSKLFLEFTSLYSCSHHILPRFPDRNNANKNDSDAEDTYALMYY